MPTPGTAPTVRPPTSPGYADPPGSAAQAAAPARDVHRAGAAGSAGCQRVGSSAANRATRAANGLVDSRAHVKWSIRLPVGSAG